MSSKEKYHGLGSHEEGKGNQLPRYRGKHHQPPEIPRGDQNPRGIRAPVEGAQRGAVAAFRVARKARHGKTVLGR